jgi:hypothetical protein
MDLLFMGNPALLPLLIFLVKGLFLFLAVRPSMLTILHWRVLDNLQAADLRYAGLIVEVNDPLGRSFGTFFLFTY